MTQRQHRALAVMQGINGWTAYGSVWCPDCKETRSFERQSTLNKAMEAVGYAIRCRYCLATWTVDINRKHAIQKERDGE